MPNWKQDLLKSRLVFISASLSHKHIMGTDIKFVPSEFSIEMTFLPADIRFETWFKGKCYGAVKTRY